MLSRICTKVIASSTCPQVSKRFIGGLAASTSSGDGPLVSELIVNVTLVDYEGNRHAITGRAGQSLRDACVLNGLGDLIKDDSNGGGDAYSAIRDYYYEENLFGEGAQSPQSHVVVSNEWFHKLPKANNAEQHILDTYLKEEDRSTNSRLGTEIILTKDLEGLVVAVPEAPPVETYEYDHVYDDAHEDDEEEGK